MEDHCILKKNFNLNNLFIIMKILKTTLKIQTISVIKFTFAIKPIKTGKQTNKYTKRVKNLKNNLKNSLTKKKLKTN